MGWHSHPRALVVLLSFEAPVHDFSYVQRLSERETPYFMCISCKQDVVASITNLSDSAGVLQDAREGVSVSYLGPRHLSKLVFKFSGIGKDLNLQIASDGHLGKMGLGFYA